MSLYIIHSSSSSSAPSSPFLGLSVSSSGGSSGATKGVGYKEIDINLRIVLPQAFQFDQLDLFVLQGVQ
jgi:hypothetical protein